MMNVLKIFNYWNHLILLISKKIMSGNADCYRFVSIKGFMYATRYLREMPFADLVSLLQKKVDEKWRVLTLKECKEEIAPQHKAIKTYLKYLQE
jgi:hypothetical protein